MYHINQSEIKILTTFRPPCNLGISWKNIVTAISNIQTESLCTSRATHWELHGALHANVIAKGLAWEVIALPFAVYVGLKFVHVIVANLSEIISQTPIHEFSYLIQNYISPIFELVEAQLENILSERIETCAQNYPSVLHWMKVNAYQRK